MARQICHTYRISARQPGWVPAIRDYLFDQVLSADDTDTMEAMLELEEVHGLTWPRDDDDFERAKDLPSFTAKNANILWLRQATPLFAPALGYAPSAAMVELLLRHQADVNGRRPNGKTPLMDACEAGQADVCRALCAGGADVALRDSPDGISAIRYAEKSATLSNVAVFNVLSARFPDVGCKLSWELRLGLLESTPLPNMLQVHKVALLKRAMSKYDAAECVRILQEFGARKDGRFTRTEWFESEGGLDELPSEYVPGFH